MLSAIIVYTANDKPFLEKCFLSLVSSAKNANISLDVILVANGTTPAQTKYLSKQPILIINKKNMGLGTAVNQAMKNVKGEWCIIVCPDVRTDKNCLKNLISLTKNQSIALIGPKVIQGNGNMQANILPYPTFLNIFLEQSFLYKIFPSIFKSPLSDLRFYEKQRSVAAIAAIWWIIKKDVFIKTGGFDKRFFLYFEDVDLCMRIKKLGFKIIFTPKSHAMHLPHKSTGGTTSGNIYFESLKKILSKYYSKPYVSICLLLFKLGCLTRLFYWRIKKLADKYSEDESVTKISFFKEVLKSNQDL